MTKYTYTTKGVCARMIEIEVENGIVSRVEFTGGCSGNTQGVSRLVEGMEVNEAIRRLSGIRCGFKATSCPDQLACALKQIVETK